MRRWRQERHRCPRQRHRAWRQQGCRERRRCPRRLRGKRPWCAPQCQRARQRLPSRPQRHWRRRSEELQRPGPRQRDREWCLRERRQWEQRRRETPRCGPRRRRPGRRAVDRGGVVGQGGGRHPQCRLGGGLRREEVGVVGVGGAGEPDPPVRLGGVAAREREVGQRRVRLRRLRGGGRGADGPLQRGAGRVDPAERLVEGGRAGEGGDVGPPLQHVPDGDAALVVPTEPARGVGERSPHRGVVRIQRQRAPGQALRLGVPALHGPQRGEPAQRGRVAVRAQLQRTAERGVGVGVAARVAGVRGQPQHERAELRPRGRVLGCGGDAGPERRGLVDARRGAGVRSLQGRHDGQARHGDRNGDSQQRDEPAAARGGTAQQGRGAHCEPSAPEADRFAPALFVARARAVAPARPVCLPGPSRLPARLPGPSRLPGAAGRCAAPRFCDADTRGLRPTKRRSARSNGTSAGFHRAPTPLVSRSRAARAGFTGARVGPGHRPPPLWRGGPLGPGGGVRPFGAAPDRRDPRLPGGPPPASLRRPSG